MLLKMLKQDYKQFSKMASFFWLQGNDQQNYYLIIFFFHNNKSIKLREQIKLQPGGLCHIQAGHNQS